MGFDRRLKILNKVGMIEGLISFTSMFSGEEGAAGVENW